MAVAKVRAHILVGGYVQGVFFRDSMRSVASRYGVTGWVRNLFDGRVEAIVEGEEQDVRAVIDWCADGPPAARVESVDVEWENYQGEFSGFFVRR